MAAGQMQTALAVYEVGCTIIAGIWVVFSQNLSDNREDRVVVSAALSKHYAKKGVVVKTKDKKCKVVFDGKDDAVSPEPDARTASCCAV